MLSFPNAKINIGLSVTGKRPDGYHNLETVFYPVKACDALEILPGTHSESRMFLSGLEVKGDPDQNLVSQALQILRKDFPQQVRPLDIFLHKALPMGAGIGGGSADAAFMLRMLNDYFDLKIGEESLQQYALQLGSDCPFFLINQPCYAAGRGEALSRIELDLSVYTLQLVCPELAVSTKDAFSQIIPKKASFPLHQIASLPLTEWHHHIANDFEATVFMRHPALAALKQQLYDAGALYASLSGSGSTVYGIFNKGTQARVSMPVLFKEFIF